MGPFGPPPIAPLRKRASQPPPPIPASPAGQIGVSASRIAPSAGANSAASDSHSQQPFNWPSELSLASLPPLPPGIAIDHLAQYGSIGLEMAIRMGMGIGMGLGQQAQQAQQQQAQAQTQPIYTQHLVDTPLPHHASSPETSNPKRGGRKPNIVREILNDDFFIARGPITPLMTPPAAAGNALFPTSRRPSSGDLTSPSLLDEGTPDEMAKRDPLATQIWKAYARGRDVLPNGQRMENLTWRMMHLTMKKQEEIAIVKEEEKSTSSTPAKGEERGRSKGKSRVVGFQKSSSPQPE